MVKWIYSSGMRAVAIFEAIKGALVLLAGFGVFTLLHRDAHEVAIELIRHLHLDPTKRLPHLFINALSQVNDAQLWLLVLLAVAYAAIRFAEAYGLWHGRRWAECFALISGAIYLPVEIYELTRGLSAIKAGALVINVLVILYMVFMLKRRYQSSIGQSVPADIPPST
jgi:uncharacterized membrane protein (DUF2068 family)